MEKYEKVTFVTGRRKEYDLSENDRQKLAPLFAEAVPLSDNVYWVSDMIAVERAVNRLNNSKKTDAQQQLRQLHDAFQPKRP